MGAICHQLYKVFSSVSNNLEEILVTIFLEGCVSLSKSILFREGRVSYTVLRDHQ